MASPGDINNAPASVRGITATRTTGMDAMAEDLHPQRYKTTTSINVENKSPNNDVHVRRASFGGNDGRGAPFFSSLMKQKRTDSAWFQSSSSFDEQGPDYGPIEKIYRRWVTGRGVSNNVKSDAHPASGFFSPPK